MSKQEIKIDDKVLSKIASSELMSDSEKLSFLKYVWYMTNSEQKELVEII